PRAGRLRPLAGRAAGAAVRGPLGPGRGGSGRAPHSRHAAARRRPLPADQQRRHRAPRVRHRRADRRPGDCRRLQPERDGRDAADRALPGRGRRPQGGPPRAQHLVRRRPQSQRRSGRVLRHQGRARHVLARGQAGTGRGRRARRLAGARHCRHRTAGRYP
ncbi:hypothetical protein OY671_011646, partial [Metschnikowia pulcherrima]